MPITSHYSNDLRLKGPCMDVIATPPLQSKNQMMFPKTLIGLIDTGCTNTCIDINIAMSLGLVAHDEQLIFTPSGKSNQPLYDVTLFFQITEDLPFCLQACGADLSEQPYDVLIGRDFLSLGILIYNGKANRWDFCI